ncbi:MAG TPA: hypothetical protein VM266_05060 [Solirubrobacteraceae bacterium]|nr:hypothetical protein [Solirubrobacteraceae bacterium]
MASRAAATAAARRHATASTYAPRAPRRVSGPARRPAPRPVPALPPRRPLSGATVGAPAPALRRLRAVPDHRMLDRLLHSRAWIWLMGIGLGGIVAMQVSLLKLNSGISRAVETSATLERSNARLREQVAALSTGERLRTGAAALGMVMPDAGSVEYLRARPGVDERRAALNLQPPSEEARRRLAAGGRDPVAPATLPGTAAPVTTTTTTPAPPATTTAPTPAPGATAPAPTATPAPTTGAAGATGAAAAPEG